MARRVSRRSVKRSASPSRRARPAARTAARRSNSTRSRRAAAPRNPTVRVVIQQAPDLSNIQARGAVSLEAAKKARF